MGPIIGIRHTAKINNRNSDIEMSFALFNLDALRIIYKTIKKYNSNIIVIPPSGNAINSFIYFILIRKKYYQPRPINGIVTLQEQ